MAYDEAVAALPYELRSWVIDLARRVRVPYHAILGAIDAGLSREEISALERHQFIAFGKPRSSQQQQRETVNRTRQSPAIDLTDTAPAPRQPIRFGMSFPRGG